MVNIDSGKLSKGLVCNRSAQMHTLEAITAVLIMITIVVFAVQATSLTPLTSSTANAHVEAQLQMIGQDMLNAADHSQYDRDSKLKIDILKWSGEEYSWDGGTYRSIQNQSDTLSNSTIADMLEYIAVRRGIAHNLDLAYVSEEGRLTTSTYINNGDPSDNAITVSRKVLVSNSDLANSTLFGSRTGIDDMDESTDFYNIVDVKLTMWRM